MEQMRIYDRAPMMDQIAAIQRLKQIWAARRGKWTAALMIGFVLNVLAVSFALGFLAMIAWPIARMLPCIGSSSIAVDIIVLLTVAIVFVFIRDYH
jgi:sterol desaturase/sphingolipid hydroxylase (fatty acid hydroxylase superfamily)